MKGPISSSKPLTHIGTIALPGRILGLDNKVNVAVPNVIDLYFLNVNLIFIKQLCSLGTKITSDS